MDIFDTTELALTRAMEGASARQAVLSGNLANANTPGYVRRDVNFAGALGQALQASDPNAALRSATFAETTDPGAVQPDGNGVDVDVESAAIAKNGMLYEALARVARSRIGIVESAIGNR